ncbi:pyruvate kinase [Citricoccus sp.]|uniref:pyruvate kinase n=1 Tax=Citricoccus sp. TaxID=1978372 RepID=UPI00261BA9D4|nr:pyruvate kinase [Citricoccus sp.]HRO30228.1 pyruvate kinase [Citricoccus sp.]
MTDSVRPGRPASADPAAPTAADLEELLAQVQELIDGARAAEADQADRIGRVRPEHRDSAANLVHYVWLRGRDIRTLQGRLADLGLSSLGRLESRVLPTLHSIAASLEGLRLARAVSTGEPGAAVGTGAGRATGWPDMDAGPDRLEQNATSLLGPSPEERVSRIMVTFPSQAATDPELVAEMLRAGMDMARINCAHDGPEQWRAMIRHLRSAQGLPPVDGAGGPGRPLHGACFSRGGEPAPDRCLVAMDLAGPKLRTGPIAPGPEVLKIRPERSATGQVVEPATVVLVAPGQEPGAHGASGGGDGIGGDGTGGDGVDPAQRIPVRDPRWVDGRAVGETLRFTDARGSARTMTVAAREPGRLTCEMAQTAYFMPGVVLYAADGTLTEVGALPPKEQRLFIRPGERLVLTRSLEPAQPVPGGPHRIGCSLAQVFDDAEPGQRIHVDDGRISGVITEVSPEEIEVRVESAGVSGSRLKAEKGINLPDTHLDIPALTEEDLAALPFVAEHADIVNLSFVRTPADVADLMERLTGLGREDLDVVLKIETVEAFENLPQILLEAMRWPDIGVMIARGDLAVEAGFERMAEVQEEILWLCESAHVPVIWATQVLDSLARTGLPSRAEVTDAAMAERAEAVMLNKGPFVVDTIAFLSGVLGRMQEHVSKKRTLLRELRSWDLFSEAVTNRGPRGTATTRPPGTGSPTRPRHPRETCLTVADGRQPVDGKSPEIRGFQGCRPPRAPIWHRRRSVCIVLQVASRESGKSAAEPRLNEGLDWCALRV